MAWVKIDDQAPRNHKVLLAGPAAAWMWVCGIAHCQAHMSEGFIAEIAIPMIGVPGTTRAKKLADRLVEVGLFERTPGGYRVHDYLEFNETRDEAIARKLTLSAKRAASGRAGGLASGRARSNEANGKQDTEAKRSPDPTRPYIEPPHPLSAKGGRLRILRTDRQEAARLLKLNLGRCTHEPPCVGVAACRAEIAAALAEQRRAAEQRALA